MLRHDLISNENFAQVGMEHGLDTCINVNGAPFGLHPEWLLRLSKLSSAL
jgi:hypothetical protein